MIKYWLTKKDKTHLIITTQDSLYTGSIKKYIKSELITKLEKGEIPEVLFSIPYSYIKSIENPERKNKITINYGSDSSEELEIIENRVKEEVFDSLKVQLPKLKYIKKKPSIFNQAKPQIFAVLIVTGLFLWAYYLANQLAKGYEYEITGGRHGISSLILGLAQFGTLKVVLGYVFIISIALFTLIKKLKNRVEVEYLTRN
jgi:hypothetical protein